jgi:hypothetical protein
MNLPIKSLKGQIIQWDGPTGHIAIQIGENYTSFGPDKSKPMVRALNKKGVPVTRYDVPGLEGRPQSLYKYEGKLRSFAADLNSYGHKYNKATFKVPYAVLPQTTTLPMRSTYQLFDMEKCDYTSDYMGKGDYSHNNCVDYVRSEIFALLGDGHRDLKVILWGIHTTKDFFLALEKHKVLQTIGAVDVIFLYT